MMASPWSSKGTSLHCRSSRTSTLAAWLNLDLPVVSFEVFKRSPQPLKAGIVATAAFRKFLEFSMYSQRCINAGSLVACSACDLIRPAASPYLSPLYPCLWASPLARLSPPSSPEYFSFLQFDSCFVCSDFVSHVWGGWDKAG